MLVATAVFKVRVLSNIETGGTGVGCIVGFIFSSIYRQVLALCTGASAATPGIGFVFVLPR